MGGVRLTSVALALLCIPALLLSETSHAGTPDPFGTDLKTVNDATSPKKGKRVRPGKRNPQKRADRLARMRAIRLQVLKTEVGLPDAKAQQVASAIEGFDGLRRGYRRSLRAARREIKRLLDADSNDMKAYRTAMKQMRSAHVDLQKLRRQEFKAVSKVLSPKQSARLMLSLERINKAVRQRFRKGKQHKGKRYKGAKQGRRHHKQGASTPNIVW